LNSIKKRESEIRRGEEFERVTHVLRSLSDKSHGAVIEVTVRNAGDFETIFKWYNYIFNVLQNYSCNWIENTISVNNLFSIHNSSEITAILYTYLKEFTFYRKLFIDVAIDHDTNPLDKRFVCAISDSQQILSAYLEDITRWLFTGRFRKYYFLWKQTGMEKMLSKKNKIEFPENYFSFPARSIIPPTPVRSFPSFDLEALKYDLKEEYDEEDVDVKMDEMHPVNGTFLL
jgi:hypothetical protein